MLDDIGQAYVAEGRYENAMQRVRDLELEILHLGEYIGRLENAVKSRGKVIMALEQVVETYETMIHGLRLELSLRPATPSRETQSDQEDWRDSYAYEEQGYWGC